jgi:hypothetical protein
LLDRWKGWEELKRKFFGFHRDLPPAAAARILGGKVVFSEQRKGQWLAVIEMERSEMENAMTPADVRVMPASAPAISASDGKSGF